ncbi:MAG: hypothetical protein IMZ55_04025, partial [Acidobacteria bacterium]|nr:hypothetical protein [Acidobacteriota bacterium]
MTKQSDKGFLARVACPARRWLGMRPGTALAYRYRVYLLLAAIVAVMTAIAPNFLTSGNFGNILKAAGVNLPAAMGFNIVMISGQLDLSIGSAMT